jgi:hypothetical protein
VLMWNDGEWVRDGEGEARYLLWMESMLNVVEKDEGVGVVVLEVGCGGTVPTVRWRSESVYQMIKKRGGGKKRRREGQEEGKEEQEDEHSKGELHKNKGRRGLIRVNPLEPQLEVGGKDEDCVSIPLNGLVTLQLLDRLLEQKKKR